MRLRLFLRLFLLLAVALGVPVAILAFSVFRIIPAGHVGVKVLFGHVDPVPLREGLNVVWNPLYDIVVMDAAAGTVVSADAATVATRARRGVTSPVPSGCTRFDMKITNRPVAGSIQTDVPVNPVWPNDPIGSSSPRLDE